MNIVLDHTRHCCSGCLHWYTSGVSERHADGYIIKFCMQPDDQRDHKPKRGSDTCSHWERN